MRRALTIVALVLTAAAAASWMTGGFRIAAGPIHLSLTNPARVAFEAALAWLLAVLAPSTQPRRWTIALAIAAVVTTAVMDSNPRRIGDGAEYAAMALNLSHGRPPAVSAVERAEIETRLANTPGFETGPVEEPLVGRDGRQDFFHFWLYPLLVAPLLAAVSLAGAHLNTAFLVANLLLLAALTWELVRAGHAPAAALIVAGPILWWVDKAHAEVFLFAMLALAALLIERAPATALLSCGLAAAQNPGAIPVLVIALAAAFACTRSGRVLLAACAACALAALPAVYYRWHLGSWSPLGTAIERHAPGVRALLTPLVDPNLGVVIYAPALCLFAASGAWMMRRRAVRLHGPVTLAFVLASSTLLLVVFAQSRNINHGGTPGMSRYALWLLALWAPLIAAGSEALRAQRPRLHYLVMAISIALSAFVFRPLAADRGGTAPSWPATWIWSYLPSLDNPLPEVFAERITGIDGAPTIPATTSRCEKILVVGNGHEAAWPIPCQPRSLPDECTQPGALCYVNGSRVTAAPSQPGFERVDDPARWTMKTIDRMYPAIEAIGTGLVRREIVGMSRWLRDVKSVGSVSAVASGAGWAAWIRPNVSARHHAIFVRLDRDVTLTWRDPENPVRVERSMPLAAAEHELVLPDRVVLLVFQQLP